MNMGHIGNLLERPKLYYNIDGVGELGGGFMLLGYSLIGWLQAHTPKDSIWHQTYVFLIYVAVMCSIIHYGSKAIKEHITYPRTGFVEYRIRNRCRWGVLGAIIGAAVSGAIVVALRRHWNLTTPASLIGLLIAASYAYGFARAVRWKWAVFVVLVAGSLVIALLPEDLIRAAGDPLWTGALLLSFMLYGTVLLVSGGISFWLYLRHTQPPARETQ